MLLLQKYFISVTIMNQLCSIFLGVVYKGKHKNDPGMLPSFPLWTEATVYNTIFSEQHFTSLFTNIDLHSTNLLCIIGGKISSPEQSDFALEPCYIILLDD